MAAADRLCLALDVAHTDDAVAWVRRTRGAFGTYKIGLQAFCAEGPALIGRIRAAGADRVFLDLKLHDIPNTVAGAVRSLGGLGVDLLTLHVGGGRVMLEAARDAAPGHLRLVGVTLLTSLDETLAAEVGLTEPPAALVARRTQLAADCGLAGVVCAPAEAAVARGILGPSALVVTPGIRLPGDAQGDQRRTTTPAAARAAGADLLVIGRAITAAPDPDAAIERVHASLADGA